MSIKKYATEQKEKEGRRKEKEKVNSPPIGGTKGPSALQE